MSEPRPHPHPDRIPESELIINLDDQSIYHLKLRPEHLADKVIVVGDPGRVQRISRQFDTIEHQIVNREFVTHTGTYKGTRVTALATGIGTDNIDIVINELDALVNIDFEKRQVKDQLRSLDIVRIGTTGALQEDIPIETFLASAYGLGFDGLLHYYYANPDAYTKEVNERIVEHLNWTSGAATPYLVKSSDALLEKIGEGMMKGITATAGGFYGPQGRTLRLPLQIPDLNEQLTAFQHDDLRVTNFEMETSALYGLGGLLGHRCVTVCVVIANRIRNEYADNYKPSVDVLIERVLERLTS